MDRIALGSGKLYCYEFSGTIPNDATIETEANRLGSVKGGASIEYKPSYYTAIDDSGKRSKTIITDEEAMLKSGIITWNGIVLKRLCSTARVTEAAGKRTVKIGGVGNYDGKRYIFRFLHEDPVDGDCRLTIMGNNQAGFSLSFVKDKETQIDAEFKAMPHDNDGTLIIYEEEIVPEQALTVTSAAAVTAGQTTVTVEQSAGSGNSFKYKTGLYIQTPTAGESAADYAAFTSGTDYTMPSGYTIVVVEVDAGGTVVKFGSVTAVSNDT